jgi:tetratricopeptide (TPR) repeat protein
MGQLPRAIELLRDNIAALDGAGTGGNLWHHYGPAVGSRNVLSWCLSWQGEFREAIERGREAIRIAEAGGNPLALAYAHSASGLVYALQGDAAGAIAAHERRFAIQQRVGRQPHPSADAFRGLAYALAGRADEAVTELERSLEGAAAIKFLPCTSLWTSWLAGAYRQSGRLDDALHTAERAVRMARDYHERGFEGIAMCELGDVVAAAENPDVARAEEHYRQALTISEDLGMRPVQAHTHLSLGKLYRRAGRPHEARAELNVAIDLYLSMEMTHWLPEAEAELAQVNAAPASEVRD